MNTKAQAGRGVAAAGAIWGPGVRLMGNVSFMTKAIIITVVFLLPVALLGYFFVSAQSDQVSFSAKERIGVEAYKKLVPVTTAVIKVRNTTRASMGGFDAAAKFSAAKGEVDSTLKAFDAYLASSGDPLALKGSVDELNAAWAKASQSSNGVGADGSTVFGPVSAALVKVLGNVGDNSNLVLDPDIDSYYLFSTLYAMPQMAEDLGQLWGWGTYSMQRFQSSKKELETKDVLRYVVWAANVKSASGISKDYMDKAVAYNPGLKTRLDLSVLDGVNAFYELAKDPDALQKSDKLTAAQFFSKGEAEVLNLASFYDKGLPVLDEILVARMDGLSQKSRVAGIAVLVVLLVAGYLFYSFYLVASGGLNAIKEHLRELASGDLSNAPAQAAGTDEPAEALNSLMTVHSVLGDF